MVRPRTIIELKDGVKVELLFTPSMYAIARRRGMRIEADASDAASVMKAYTELMYLAALNAHEVMRFDDPSLGEFPYRLIDFVEWSALCPDGFTSALDVAVQNVLGKSLDELKGEKPAEPSKKNSNSTTTTRRWRSSL